MVDVPALAAFVDAFRLSIKLPVSSPGEGSDCDSAVDWETLISLGLLQLKPDAFEPLEEDTLPIDEQTEEQILRPYPSVRCFAQFQMFQCLNPHHLIQLHSCFVCNVVAAVSVLSEGQASRFVRRGSIPPVYLSCTMNYILDDDCSSSSAHDSVVSRPSIETYEPAIVCHQELCVDEAARFEEVRWCLHPTFGCDWLAFFNHYFVLDHFFELWKGENFVGTSKSRPRTSRRSLECFPCYSLHRSTLENFDNDSNNMDAFGGCVVVFRHLSPNSQLFGVWFLWLRIKGSLMIVDLQNSNLSHSLQAAILCLGWDSPPMPDVFFAPFKREFFGSVDSNLPKNPRSTNSEGHVMRNKVTKAN